MIVPSALNVTIIGLSVIVFGFLWRLMSAWLADSPFGQAMAAVY